MFVLIIGLAQISFFTITLGTNHPKEKAAKHFHIADKAYAKGQFKKTLRHLKKAHELDPSTTKYIKYIGKTYHRVQDYSNALKYFKRFRESIQDEDPVKALKLLIYEGGYSLAIPRPKEAFERFRMAVEMIKTYHVTDSLSHQDSILISSLYNNWGVAELFDQGYNDPCNSTILGGCWKINILDLKRAADRFLLAQDYAPDECNRMAMWNYSLIDQILSLPKEYLKYSHWA